MGSVSASWINHTPIDSCYNAFSAKPFFASNNCPADCLHRASLLRNSAKIRFLLCTGILGHRVVRLLIVLQFRWQVGFVKLDLCEMRNLVLERTTNPLF
jgi:hypothetical protein